MAHSVKEKLKTAERIISVLVNLPDGSWLTAEKALEVYNLVKASENEEKLDAYLEELVRTAERIGMRIHETNIHVQKIAIQDAEEMEKQNHEINTENLFSQYI